MDGSRTSSEWKEKAQSSTAIFARPVDPKNVSLAISALKVAAGVE
jgi:hypothetical protein